MELSDAPQIQELFPQWEVVRHLAKIVPWPYPADGARTFLETRALPAMEHGEAWHWSLRLKSKPEQLIGSIGLMTSGDMNRGFWIAPQWQRQGLMTEAAKAVTDYWFDVLRFPVLRTNKAVDNTGSSRISRNQGMRIVAIEERDFVCGRLPAEICEITAEEWCAHRGKK